MEKFSIEKIKGVDMQKFAQHNNGVDYFCTIDEVFIAVSYNSDTFDSSEYPQQIIPDKFFNTDKFNINVKEETKMICIYITDKKEE